MTDEIRPMDHAAVDELGAAYALDALEPDEARAVREHLATCSESHAELRALLGADQILAASLEPMEPSPALRERVMASIERTAQDRAAVVREPVAAESPRRGGWRCAGRRW